VLVARQNILQSLLTRWTVTRFTKELQPTARARLWSDASDLHSKTP
jgi:hypothetical protein